MKKYKKFIALFTLIVMVFTCCVLVACEEAFGDWIVTKEPTCTEEGERIRYSKSDETVFETEVIPALGHSWIDEGDEEGWVVIEEPTYVSEGMAQRICSRCEKKETKILDMIDEPVHLKVMDGDTLLTKVYVDDDGNYDLAEVEISKLGYTLAKFVDEKGADFAISGSLAQNTVVYAQWDIVDTTTLAQLAEYAAGGVDRIHLAADIEVTQSIFVVGKTEIYIAQDRTITRSANFDGDMFVIGETPNGESTQIVYGRNAALTLKTQNDATLTIDGNKDNVEVEVGGTAFLIVYGADFNMHEGVVLQNCQKVKNIKLLEQDENGSNKYALSYINRIGGAAIIVVNGTFNMYGGTIANNEVNIDEPEMDGEDDENDDITRMSTCGGAIYSNSNVNINGGVIEHNKAARGGAIYNYRKLSVNKGEFNQNQAAVYGGAVYLPGSQYAELFIGEENATQNLVTFEANFAEKSGGAVFGQMKNSVTIYGGATFTKNTSGSNGGAINTSGALTVYDATFSENKAASKGGAIYVYYSDIELTTRQVSIAKGSFVANEASKGGAIAFSASDVEFEKGAIGFVGEVTFQGNKAFATETDDPDLSDSEDDSTGTFNGNGGAIYIARNSDVTIDGATFAENNAAIKAGAIYATGSSLVSIANAQFNANTSDKKAGAIYITNAANVEISDSQFNANIAEGSGGAILCYTDSVLKVEKTTFTLNESHDGSYGGGAVYFAANSTGYLCEVTFTENKSTNKNGGAIGAYGGSHVVFNQATFTDNTAKGNGGAIYIASSQTTVIMDGVSTFTNNSAKGSSNSYGGAIYMTCTSGQPGSLLRIKEVNATDNSAVSGGFLYITTTGTTAYIYGGTIQNNTATTSGNNFCGNAAKAYLYIQKSALTMDDYTLAGKGTLTESIDEEWGSWETQEQQ